MAIIVVNKRTHEPTDNDIYIGRGSALGNPFTHMPLNNTKAEFQCNTRDESIDMYKDWLLKKVNNSDKAVINMLIDINNKHNSGIVYLVCYCKPLRCHGDIIKQFIENEFNT